MNTAVCIHFVIVANHTNDNHSGCISEVNGAGSLTVGPRLSSVQGCRPPPPARVVPEPGGRAGVVTGWVPPPPAQRVPLLGLAMLATIGGLEPVLEQLLAKHDIAMPFRPPCRPLGLLPAGRPP